MPYIVNSNGITCRWVDPSENYQLQVNESFSDSYPELVAPEPVTIKTDFEKVMDFLVSENITTKEKADAAVTATMEIKDVK